MKAIYILTFSLVFLCQIESKGQDKNNDPGYAKALQAYYEREYQVSAQLFTDVVTKDPKNYSAFLYRGNCYAYLRQFSDAEKDYKKAGKHLKDNAGLYFGYGFLYNEMGNYKKAIDYLNKSIAIDSKNAVTYNTLGVSYQRLGNIRQAIESYSAAIKIDSTLGIAYSNRGTAIYENQDIAPATNLDIRNAIKDFDKAIKFSPGLCLAWRNRGLANGFIKKYDLALNDLDQAIKCNNNDAVYYINRGTLLTTMGRYQPAIDDFKYSITINKNLPQAYLLMGDAYFKDRHTQDAVSAEMEAAILDKNYKGLADYNIARYYGISKNKELMMKYLELAKKYDYFMAMDNLANFLKNPEFLPYKQDKEFNDFRISVRGNRM